MSKLTEALAALGEIRERIERNDKRGYCCLHCETTCYSCEYEVPLLVAAVEEASADIKRWENVADQTAEELQRVRDQERQAIASAEAAEGELAKMRHKRP